MKTLDLVALSLGLTLSGCPGDDGNDDGADSSDPNTSAPSSMSTSTGNPPDTTGEPSMTTGDPPDTTGDPSETTGDPPDDTTGFVPQCPEETTGEGAMSFEADVWPILMANCLGLPGSCHDPGSGGLMMLDAAGAYANLVDVASTESSLVRIDPGCPDGSYLWAKINGNQVVVGGSGGQMPLGAAALPPEDLDTIEQWILNGAQP